jgi:hypothetical protein
MRIFVAAAVLLGIAVPLRAHHSDTNYELSKESSVTGTVTDFRFVNPHVLITLEVTDGNGAVVKWMAQATSPNMLVHRGWNSTTLKPGHKIVIVGHRAKNGSPIIKVNDISQDGKDIY